MKVYLFVFLVAVAAIFFIYWAGMENGCAKCAAARSSTYIEQQAEIIKYVEDTNEKTFNTAVHDIRRVLREKYTIAE